MTRRFIRPVLVAVALLVSAAQAGAQTPASFFELTTGVWWSAPMGFSTPDALEVDRNGEPSRLFAAESGVDGAFGIGAAAAFRLTDRWQIEAGAIYSRPALSVQLSDDIEDAESATAEEDLHRIQIDAGVLVRLGSAERRNQPFASAGVSYLRELHEGQTLADNGQAVFAGGGFKRVLRSKPDALVDVMGLRFEARLVVRTGGINLDDRTHVTAAAAAALFLRF